MLDHARTGFHATLDAVPYICGGLVALTLVAIAGTVLVIIGDTLIGSILAEVRTRRIRRS